MHLTRDQKRSARGCRGRRAERRRRGDDDQVGKGRPRLRARRRGGRTMSAASTGRSRPERLGRDRHVHDPAGRRHPGERCRPAASHEAADHRRQGRQRGGDRHDHLRRDRSGGAQIGRDGWRGPLPVTTQESGLETFRGGSWEHAHRAVAKVSSSGLGEDHSHKRGRLRREISIQRAPLLSR